MHISDLLDENKLKEEVKLGYISERIHNSLPLKIYNYTPVTQYSQHWNEVTLQCRGLIINDAGTVIARPFEKIFNYAEVKDSLDTSGPVSVTDKLDGSLGICFIYGGEYHVATRGSFHSEQAEWATAFVRARSEYQQAIYNIQEQQQTPLVEIIYPENRVVVDYGKKEDLILLGVRNYGNDKSDVPPVPAGVLAGWPIGSIALQFRCDNFNEALSLPPRKNAEGVVVYFGNTGIRVKIKQEDYVRLHKTIFSFSKKAVWEDLSSGLFLMDILEKLPDETHDLLQQYTDELSSEYNLLLDDIMSEYERLYLETTGGTRKEWAYAIKDHKYKNYFWSILDRNFHNLEKAIWKAIKPRG